MSNPLRRRKKGAETAKNIIKSAIGINIKHLTLYAFSAENWKRGPDEISGLISLLRYFVKNEIQNLINRIDKVENMVTQNSSTVNIINKVFWVIVVGFISAITWVFIENKVF